MTCAVEHILCLSYGKDSLACLGAIEKLGWPLDRVVTVDVMATDTIPADLPPMVEFKAVADKIIQERFGIKVEHVTSGVTFERGFYFKRGRTGRKTKHAGDIYGWPLRKGQWCLQQLKRPAFQKIGNSSIQYVGIAADERKRFNNLTEKKKSPLVELGWTEADCRRWCEENGMLSPIYTTEARGGCWFCHNQGAKQLRRLRKNCPEYWALMLKWDKDSCIPFHEDGRTVRDYEARFQLEDAGLVLPDQPFRWSWIDEVQLTAEWFLKYGGYADDLR